MGAALLLLLPSAGEPSEGLFAATCSEEEQTQEQAYVSPISGGPLSTVMQRISSMHPR
jgi:hypothetical protein